MIKTKCVHSEISADDGLRILATRFRGRGMPADRYDVWMANLGPSEKILKAVIAGKLKWGEFLRRYRAEMSESSRLDASNKTIKNHGQKFTLRLIKCIAEKQTVTLLCHCAEDAKHCHRFELKRLIDKA